MKYFRLISLVILFTACSHAVDPPSATDEVLIVNKTGETIYYAAVEQEFSTLIDWAPISRDQNRLAS